MFAKINEKFEFSKYYNGKLQSPLGIFVCYRKQSVWVGFYVVKRVPTVADVAMEKFTCFYIK